jgi:hypothetical protein
MSAADFLSDATERLALSKPAQRALLERQRLIY